MSENSGLMALTYEGGQQVAIKDNALVQRKEVVKKITRNVATTLMHCVLSVETQTKIAEGLQARLKDNETFQETVEAAIEFTSVQIANDMLNAELRGMSGAEYNELRLSIAKELKEAALARKIAVERPDYLLWVKENGLCGLDVADDIAAAQKLAPLLREEHATVEETKRELRRRESALEEKEEALAESRRGFVKTRDEVTDFLAKKRIYLENTYHTTGPGVVALVAKTLCGGEGRLSRLVDYLIGEAKTCYCCSFIRGSVLGLLTGWSLFGTLWIIMLCMR